MPAAPMIKPSDVFTADDWKSLSQRSLWRGPWMVADCWIVIAAAMLVFPLVTRIRNIAEHACVPDNDDPMRYARTVEASLAERMFIAPYYVHYHAEHHMFAQLPCYRLGRAHAMLKARGFGPKMEIQPNYKAVLQMVTSSAIA